MEALKHQFSVHDDKYFSKVTTNVMLYKCSIKAVCTLEENVTSC